MRTRASAFALLLCFVGCSSPSSTASAPPGDSSSTTARRRVDADRAPALPEIAADPREQAIAESVGQLLAEEHLTHLRIDDALSKKAFLQYMERLDGGKMFLLKEHVTALERFSDDMDDELKEGDLVLARKGAALIAMRREVVAKLVADILTKPFDFAKDEQVETDPKKVAWAAGEAELRTRWEQILKLQVLERVAQLDDLAESLKTAKKPDPAVSKPLEDIPPTSEGREAKAREELTTSYQARFTRLASPDSLEAADHFLNAIAASFDPHTLYLAPAEKENFDIDISGTLEGIGASLKEEDHYIVVKDLVPGGASWKQGKLEAGDLILAVAQKDGKPVDVTDMPIDKVVKMIRGPKGTVVTLTVKKPDNRIDVISITRDVVGIEASFARGAILDLGPKSEPKGYIYLPGFYDNTRAEPGTPTRNATDDIRKLLEAFQKRRVNGVILDLRGNGGGLLGHARDVSGLFIEKGPVVQTRASNGEIEVLEDKDPSVAYSGEVIVLVDRFSASAAEIVTAALQDYHRALIVGTAPTHGKGTVQVVADLDRMRNATGLGVLKLTIQQYFGPDGESVQWRGVVPDVLLPDPAGYIESGERFLDNSIPWTKIDALPFQPEKHTWDAKNLGVASHKRVAVEPVFEKIELRSKLLKERRDQTLVPLEMKKWQEQRKRDKADLESVALKLDEGPPRFEVSVLDPSGAPSPVRPAPKPGAEKGEKTTVRDRLEKWRDDLARDPWVEESLRVLDDMVAAR